jgi:hypothetical protein
MSATSVFLNSRRLCSDDCAKEARDLQNDGIYGYEMFQHLPVACDGVNARFPTFAYDHINLRGRAGYGVAEGCVVDRYSALRNDPAQLTRDRCRTQLFTRIFTGCPNLKPGVSDPDKEMPILQGTGSSTLEGVQFPCKKTIMEQQTNKFAPLLECVQQVQKPDHVVEPWVRGGEDTRSFVKRQEFLAACGQANLAHSARTSGRLH